MAITDDIRAALDTELAGLPGLPTIAFENVDFDPTPGTPYLTTSFSLTSRRPATRGRDPQKRYQGLYQVTVAVPRFEGIGQALEYADTIMAAFDAATDVTHDGLTIGIEYSELGAQATLDPFYLLPVRIAWYVHAA